MRVCPNPKCGKTIENDKAKFCRYCGMELPVIPEPPVTDEVVPDEVVDEGIILSSNPAKGNSSRVNPVADLHPNFDGISLGFADNLNISNTEGNSLGVTDDAQKPGSPSTSNTPNTPPQNNVNTNYKQPYVPRKPDNYLEWAILSTVFCCLPCGVYAIVCASNVNSLYASGDYTGAQKASENAKKWSIIAAIASLIVWVILIIIANLSTYSGYESEASPYLEETDTCLTIIDDEEAYSLDLLESGINDYKRELPQVIEEGVTMIDIELNEACVLYIAECDESIIDIDALNSMKSTLREQIKSFLLEKSSNDYELSELLENCKKAKRGIGYKYVGDHSGDVCTVMVSYTQL